MALLVSWCPPSREHWEWIVFVWQFFPVITLLQWILEWYPAGKTSQESRWNVPGKIGWITMEAPGFILLLYIMKSLPAELHIEELPWWNWVMAGMFTFHYIYRSIICPLLNPSMSPMHIIVWLGALSFQIVNATSLGGYLAGYGPIYRDDWPRTSERVEIGMMIWAIGLMLNMYHDDELREIRRAAARQQRRRDQQENANAEKRSVSKVYMIPQNGLFRFILYPHYLTEWIEWSGLWMMGGSDCIPMRIFVLNEIATMLPRALQGRRWYERRFGAAKLQGKKAIIPWLL